MTRLVVLLAALLLPCGSLALAQTVQRCFVGYAYHLESGTFAYTETHHQTLQDGKPVSWQVTYRDPQGNIIATKNMDFSRNPLVPVYRMQIPAEGYMEGIGYDNAWVMYRREKTGSQIETQPFALKAPIVGDAGFNGFVKAHFKALMQGQTVKFSFAVAGRLSVIDMKALRIQDTTFEGQPAVQFKAQLDMFLINLFVDPITLVYDPDSMRLLEYRGISNMHGADGKPYPVRVSYYTQPPPAAAQNAAGDSPRPWGQCAQ